MVMAAADQFDQAHTPCPPSPSVGPSAVQRLPANPAAYSDRTPSPESHTSPPDTAFSSSPAPTSPQTSTHSPAQSPPPAPRNPSNSYHSESAYSATRTRLAPPHKSATPPPPPQTPPCRSASAPRHSADVLSPRTPPSTSLSPRPAAADTTGP